MSKPAARTARAIIQVAGQLIRAEYRHQQESENGTPHQQPESIGLETTGHFDASCIGRQNRRPPSRGKVVAESAGERAHRGKSHGPCPFPCCAQPPHGTGKTLWPDTASRPGTHDTDTSVDQRRGMRVAGPITGGTIVVWAVRIDAPVVRCGVSGIHRTHQERTLQADESRGPDRKTGVELHDSHFGRSGLGRAGRYG